MKMKNSVLDDYNNDYSYPRRYKDDQDIQIPIKCRKQLSEFR